MTIGTNEENKCRPIIVHIIFSIKFLSKTFFLQLLIDRNKIALYLLDRFKKLFFLPQNRTKQEHILQNVTERRKNERFLLDFIIKK